MSAANVPEIVSLGLLRRYLEIHGWRLAEGLKPPFSETRVDEKLRELFGDRASGSRGVDVYILSASDQQSVELLVPRNRTVRDFEVRMEGAIETLSQVEDTTPERVIAAIRSIGMDVVRSHIPSQFVINDSIRLEQANIYVRCMKELLAATGTTELRPLPFFGRLSKKAQEYSDNCRFGHTYRGSFGFTIESPLSPNTEEPLFGEPVPPFERRVVERLAIGIRQISEAVASDDITPVVKGFLTGFGANACDRFATLIHDTAYSGMSFIFSFSSEWLPPKDLDPSFEFYVGPQHVEAAREAARALYGDAVERPTQVHGTVVRLQNEADPTDLSPQTGEGEISVLFSSEDYGDIHLRVSLTPPEYLKAVEAHRLGRKIRINGTLVHKGRFWYLLKPSPIIITDDPEQLLF